MSNNKYFYIDGAFCSPAAGDAAPTHGVVNPATEELLFQLPLGSSADVELAVAAASKAFESYANSSVEERQKLLTKVLDNYCKRRDDLAKAISDEMGAPFEFARDVQVWIGQKHLETFIAELHHYPFEQLLGKAHIFREPIGVVGMITPWNWPMNQICLKVGAALAAGCTMVLKPSEFTPTSAKVFAEILHAAGVPKGVFNLVQGYGPDVGVALSSHPRIAMISFTGSTRAGIDVAIKAAPTVKRVSQELGGKSANILLDDASFAEAVRRGAAHCFQNCGQSCNAPTRMLVPRNRLNEAAEVAAKVAASTTATPVVNKIQFEKIQGLIAKGIEEGAVLAAGGVGRPDGKTKGYYIRPTVFSGVSNSMTIAREEIFGPVLSILPYDNVDQAIEIANDTPYGLAGYVQGEDMKTVHRIARKLRAGNVAINGTPAEFRAPFGGYKQSGNGREMGHCGIDDVVEIKAVVGW